MKKKSPSSAMMSRMATLESKLASRFAAIAGKTRTIKKGGRTAMHKSNGRGTSITVASDGLNRSRVVTNGSAIEDRFAMRREKIGDINGSSTFSVGQSLFINPGNNVLFPIFSQIAPAYEQYRVNTLRFVLETEAYTASGSNQTAGIACLVTNFDVADATFTSLTQGENYEGSVKGPPYATVMSHDVITAHKKRGGRTGNDKDLPLKSYFVWPSANTSGPGSSVGDSKFYDVGLFQLLLNNMVGNGVIGELYVEYSFTMIRPKQPTPGQSSLLQYLHLQMTGTSTAAAPLTSAVLVSSTGALTQTHTTAAVTVSGLYVGGQFCAFFQNQASNITGAPTMSFSGGSALDILASSPFGTNTVNGVVTDSQGLIVVYFTATSGTAVFTLTGGTASTAGYADFILQQIPSAASVAARPPLDSSSSSSSSISRRLSPGKLDRLYAKLVELGCIEEDDESPVTVTGDDGVVRVSQPDYDRPLGVSTSAPLPSAGFSKVPALVRK